jgi:hypothetical protein
MPFCLAERIRELEDIRSEVTSAEINMPNECLSIFEGMASIKSDSCVQMAPLETFTWGLMPVTMTNRETRELKA